MVFVLKSGLMMPLIMCCIPLNKSRAFKLGSIKSPKLMVSFSMYRGGSGSNLNSPPRFSVQG